MDAIITAALALLTQVGPSIASSGVLALLAKIAPSIATSAGVGKAVEVVAALLPAGIQLARDEIPIIKSVIAGLRGNSSTTAAQMDELDALDAQTDARVDAAIEKAEAEDARNPDGA